MAQKSKYRPINESKYRGDDVIICRSSWERALCKYFDNSSSIKYWSSEPFAIQYKKPTTGRMHRYFPDFFIETSDGVKILIEVKPKHETIKPIKKPRQQNKTFARQKITYAINDAKWKYAQEFCKKNGIQFQIWTQDTIKSLGIKLIT